MRPGSPRYWSGGLIGLLLTVSVQAETFTGSVISVHDGDTLTVRTGYRRVKVRLAAIDAPELDQSFGQESQRHLSQRALHRTVTVVVQKIDDYGRTIGTVTVAGTNVEAEQVRQGWAWVYRQYSRDAQLLALEAQAKAARRGLWSEAHPTPPWDWRHRRSGRVSPPVSSSTPTVFTGSCETKSKCSEMSSCEEAQFYLTQCAVRRLDGDGDGIPCEALCRSVLTPKSTR